jgi:hypothetical protein
MTVINIGVDDYYLSPLQEQDERGLARAKIAIGYCTHLLSQRGTEIVSSKQ